MKQAGRNRLVLLLLAGILWGCSTKKNTLISRTYHDVNARYNVFFNAKESFKSGIQRIDQSIPEDFTRPLPIDKGTLPEAAKAATSEMEQAITKCFKLISLHSITKGPPRKSKDTERYKKFASKGEYNNWVDDSYLMMGKANYYTHDFHRAIENFNFVIRKFSNNSIRYDAYLWMARCYVETGDNKLALEIFSSLERDGGLPKRLKKDLSLAQAQYYLKDNQIDETIKHLRAALTSSLSRKEKLRVSYLLAQLLVLNNKLEEGSAQYLKVLKMHPPYQMSFNAKLSRIEIGGGDSKEIGQELQKLLDNIMNADYRDRIYFAKGEIAFREGRKSDAIADLKKSVLYSSQNPKQRALSSLNLARMLFEDNEYKQASCYYDSAVAVIDDNYPGYIEIMTRAAGLKKLAENLEIVSREDSLQRLALMTEQDRNKVINGIIAKLQQEEAKKSKEENAQATDRNYFRSQQFRPQISAANDQNLWYFYNTLTIGIGKSEFQRIWGKRKLEDNWRRKNKLSVSEEDTTQIAGAEVEKKLVPVENKRKANDPKSAAFYMQDIPLTDSLRKVSNELIKGAMFNAGRIYRTDFNDFRRSSELFESLNTRFPGSIYELPAFFELYQLFKENSNVIRSDEFRTKIISGYPESKYAKYLINPKYFTELAEQNALISKRYEGVLQFFEAYDYSKAAAEATAVLAMKPDSNLIPKAKFIELVSKGASQDRGVFGNALDQYIKTSSSLPLKAIAVKIKDLITTNSLNDYQQLLAKGYIKEEIVNNELKDAKNKNSVDLKGKYSIEEDMFHYYVIAFSKEAKVDVNRLIYDLANYNLDYYTSTDFDIEAVNLDSKTQFVVVRSLPNKEESLIYFRSLIRKRNVFQALKGIEYVNFVTSSTNYRVIIAEKGYLDYLQFFTKSYSAYIGANVPVDELPSPEVLLSNVRKKEEPTEKGRFVLIPQTTENQDTAKQISPQAVEPQKTEYKGSYLSKPGKDYNYALIFMKKSSDSDALVKAYEKFNQANFGAPSIKVSTESLDNNRSILVVSGLNDLRAANAYFQKAGSDPSLSALIKGNTFRSFIISNENLPIFLKEKNLLLYMEFFNQLK